MKLAELSKLLKAGEWSDVEFKESRTDVPKSAFETVSAFANTHGGRLVFGDDARLWEPGEKEVRNPSIAMAMRRIAMCEQAGTGLRMMREAWQKLGHPSPTYKNDRAWKAFELFIPGLDKEVDMASDLMKAMFGRAAEGDSVLVGGKNAPEAGQSAIDRETRRILALKIALKSSVKSALKTASFIMDAMEKDPGITIPDLGKAMAVSQRTVNNHILRLKQAGIIRRIGPDKGGHWEVKTISEGGEA